MGDDEKPWWNAFKSLVAVGATMVAYDAAHKTVKKMLESEQEEMLVYREGFDGTRTLLCVKNRSGVDDELWAELQRDFGGGRYVIISKKGFRIKETVVVELAGPQPSISLLPSTSEREVEAPAKKEASTSPFNRKINL